MSIVVLSNEAKEYLICQMVKSDKKYVLLQAKGGGCAGFKYDWSYPNDQELNTDDDYITLNENYTLIIDKYSAFKLIGMKIDYIESISGSSLEIVNPNATSTCGCGESFS
jgi:iron-sulfur cluster assembly accessory protein